ncbi:MAG: anion permease [Verrucomicrobia bacterium]|nr:anion permease [Verrucomicrobiota bacterium]
MEILVSASSLPLLLLAWQRHFTVPTCFATPVGYQTNTMVYGAGGYRFTDFTKVGVPLNVIFWVLAVWFIPKFWPF